MGDLMRRGLVFVCICLFAIESFALTVKTGQSIEYFPFEYEGYNPAGSNNKAASSYVTKISKAAGYTDVYEVQLSYYNNQLKVYTYLLKKGDLLELKYSGYSFAEKVTFVVTAVSENEISLSEKNKPFADLVPSEDLADSFGLKNGMSFEQVKQACGGREPQRVGADSYLIVPPHPNPYFIKYTAYIDEKVGLYYLKAEGDSIFIRSGFGKETEAKFNSLEEKLKNNYGKNEKLDVWISYEKDTDPKNWAFKIKENHAFLMSVWEKKYGSSLPSDIKKIYLKVEDANHINLECAFQNIDRLAPEKKEENASVFMIDWWYTFAKDHSKKRK